ncbi:hypothetical protein PybrP1_001663 [[Pythium] brassicae (nom. inval.)]|nr:hypothetical protein PybrP1_001663 [[Pythium] brassicae (nom. inval.)]
MPRASSRSSAPARPASTRVPSRDFTPAPPDATRTATLPTLNVGEGFDVFQQQQQPQQHGLLVSPLSGEIRGMETAVAILETIVREHALQSETAHHRGSLLERADALHASEAKEYEMEQLAYLEHMRATMELLQRDLEKERHRSHTSPHNNACDLEGAAATEPLHGYLLAAGGNTGVSVKSTTKRTKLPARLLQSPLRGRLGSGPTVAQESAQADLQNALEKSANSRIRARTAEKRAIERERREHELAQRGECGADTLVSAREQKLREALGEKAHWQQAYEAMRDQVVEEKTRQTELFRRLEQTKRDSLRRTDKLERALRECCLEIELLRSQLAETQVCAVQQKRAMGELARGAKEEKDRLVCNIAETRHKFREWKEGEAGTLKAARDQAVHNLKTEYELKIARHHEEKQKLRDKVKDLEVSLRLLQKDRNLSPTELSLRKATILGSKDGGSTSEAELIEANCRIKELEALLTHAKEYQKRQEHIIRASESTMTRMMQEREVVALENLALQPLGSLPAGSLSLTKAVDSTDSVLVSGVLAMPRHSEENSGASTPVTKSAASATGEFGFDGASASAASSSLSTPRLSIVAGLTHNAPRKRSTSDSPSAQRRQSGAIAKYATTGESALSSSSAADPEKEILRRQSIVLSAEVEKYRQIVVHSLDEIRVLKDNRRRSHHGMLPSGPHGNATTLKEQYLMGEVIRLQGELEALKGLTKKKKKRERRTIAKEREAVKVILNKSKAFLLRRDFVRQKLAIGKIKARYRGYLVRKNIELLDRHHQKQLVVSQAVQYKMEIVDAHHEMTCTCHGLLLRLVIRVSKDPPIVQIRMTPAAQWPTDAPAPNGFRGPRVAYVHLFEIVALLPHDEESAILDKASESEIAQTFAALLSVVRMGGQYKFAIKRKQADGAANPHEHIVHFGVFPASGSLLSELPVEKMPERRASRTLSDSSAADARELEDLIQKARVPLVNSAVRVDVGDIHADLASRADHVHLKKFLRRLSSSSLDIIPESPQAALQLM